MTEPTLSVVLCTYNGEAYLRAQLDSLLNQARLPDEIIAGDDCSVDSTWAVLEAFAIQAKLAGVRVRLIRQERNRGFVINFTETLKQASGDVLFLCDQDDRWHHDKIATMAHRFEEDPNLLLLFSDARRVDGDGQELPHSLFDALELAEEERRAVRQGEAFDVLLRRSMVTGATAAFRRQLLDTALPVGDGWIHDEWLAVVAAATGRVGMIERALIDYRQHANNQIGMRKRSLSDKWIDLVRPRRQQFIEEVRRMASLQLLLAKADADRFAVPLARIERKRIHFERRIALGALPHWARLPGVLQEAARGNYRRFGTGRRSMLRDLLRRE